MKKLGQHFLTDPRIIQKIVATAAPKRGETIIEIGAGHGEVTVPLARACANAGAHLMAIEKDPRLTEEVRNAIRGMREGIEVREGDVRALLPPFVAALSSPYKLVGDLPFYLVNFLLRMIGALKPKPVFSLFMVQREVAERIAARPPRMNRLAASLQFWARPSIRAVVPRSAFRPPPRVDGALLLLEPIPRETNETAREAYYHTLRIIFGQPRKTIFNNLRDAEKRGAWKTGAVRRTSRATASPPELPHGLGRPDAHTPRDILLRAHIPASARAENLTVEDILALSRVL